MPWLVALALLLTLPKLAFGDVVPASLRARALAEGSVRVLVTVDAAPTPARQIHRGPTRAFHRRSISSAQLDVLARLVPGGVRRTRTFSDLPLLALDANPSVLDALEASARVLAVEEDMPLQPQLVSSVPVIGGDDASNAGFDGSGWAVAVIDTGVDSSHLFLAGKVVAEACFSTSRDCPNGRATQVGPGAGAPCDYSSECVHGTLVAGAAAGYLEGGVQGVAPAAELIAVQVSSQATGSICPSQSEDPCQLAYTSDVLAGLEYVAQLANSFAIGAVNVSLGSGLYSSSRSCDNANRAWKTAIDTLRDLDIATVASAGNNESSNGMTAPACISSAVGVGAVDDRDEIWSGSNSDSMLDLLAPGVFIRSSVPTSYFPDGWATRTGTSLAAPHVSGAWALARQADPEAGVSDILAVLQDTGLPLLDDRNGLTRTRIAIDEALRELSSATCYDGIDNDGDGLVDFPDDESCETGWSEEVSVPEPAAGLQSLFSLAALALLRRRRIRQPSPDRIPGSPTRLHSNSLPGPTRPGMSAASGRHRTTTRRSPDQPSSSDSATISLS
jgi:subtilisin family serine protease